MSSITEIQLNKLRAPALFAPMIYPPPPHTLSGTRFAQIIGGNRARKRARSLFNCISVTDGIKISEQNNPIAKGTLYVQAEFGAILSIPAESYGEFEPLGVSDVAILAWDMFKTPKCVLS